MAKTTARDDDYQPDLLAETPGAQELELQLTGKSAVDRIAAALRGAAFDFDPDDYLTIATAQDLQVEDADAYARGYDLLAELSNIESRISTHYARFDKPLNFLIKVVRGLKSPQAAQVSPVKKGLAERLGAWKIAQDERDRQEQARRQEAQDLAARAAQDARAASLERVAAIETNTDLAESLRREAESVRNQQVSGPLIERKQTAPKVSGYTRERWSCEFDDVRALVTAYVEQKCFIPDEAFIDGLQGYMDDQATSLKENLGKAYPGTHAVRSSKAVARRR